MSNSFEIDTDAMKRTAVLWQELGGRVQTAWGQLMDAHNAAMSGGAFSDGDTGRQVFSQYEGALAQVEPAVTGAIGSMDGTGQDLITESDGFAAQEEVMANNLERGGFGPKPTDV
jgi:hypothetical protein